MIKIGQYKKGKMDCFEALHTTGEANQEKIKGVITHGGRYVQYNVHGSLFEVSSKYVPPIRPIGRGASGLVWYAFLLIFISCVFMKYIILKVSI